MQLNEDNNQKNAETFIKILIKIIKVEFRFFTGCLKTLVKYKLCYLMDKFG